MSRLLIIDDDPLILDCFRYGFVEPEYTVVTATSGAEGVDLLSEYDPDVVLLDIRLPDMSGLAAFGKLHELDPKIPVILMTGHGTADTAIEAMRLGAYEYVLKPFDADALEDLIGRAVQTSRLMRVPAILGDQGQSSDSETSADDTVDVLIGHCPAMQDAYRSIGRVAAKDVIVLILGESGSGKEVVARAIYHYSHRSTARFLAVNCAAIPEQLLESELFGHEKGAFTGADLKRLGKFELCNDGTLFLDEIGDMYPAMQAKILRVLQDQQFERVGGDETIHTNARLIVASNQDLEQMIADGEFRSDLYYRLNVYTIKLPPLREREEDLPLLVEHFLRRFGRELDKEVTQVSPDAMELLRRHHWPGNVRELQSAVKHALLEATGPVLVPAFLPASIRGETSTSASASVAPSADSSLVQMTQERLKAGSTEIYAELIGLVERQVISEVLRHAEGNLTQAARHLGITRNTLRFKLTSLGIAVDRTISVEETGTPEE